MDFTTAARIQHNRKTIYTVILVSPDGTREQIGTTARKTGTGLIRVLQGDAAQARIKTIPGIESAGYKKTADALIIDNGYRITFGDTIRNAASLASPANIVKAALADRGPSIVDLI